MKKKIVLTRKVLEVTPLPNTIGHDIYNISDFTVGKNYKVFGAVWFSYADRSGDFCWLVQNEEGAVVPKAMKHFSVVKYE